MPEVKGVSRELLPVANDPKRVDFRAAIIHAATTVFPNAVVAKDTVVMVEHGGCGLLVRTNWAVKRHVNRLSTESLVVGFLCDSRSAVISPRQPRGRRHVWEVPPRDG